MVYSDYTKLRILHFHTQGYRSPAITKHLHTGVVASQRRVAKFLNRCLRKRNIARLPGSGRKSLITDEVRKVVEQQIRQNNEMTASQLFVHLRNLGYRLNLQTILRCRTSLG